MQRPIILLAIAFCMASVLAERISIDGMGTTYEVTAQGKGDLTVQNGLSVTVHTTGYLAATQKPFWSTHDGDKPMDYTQGAGNLIKGFEAGILGAKVGESRTVHIPAKEAYGASGAGDVIPPNSDIMFDISVTKIDGKGEADL
jgi:FKBP-type peptidyl-prolyl cis-trans isomerase